VASVDSAGATLSSRGSEEYATNGTADFTSLQLKGTINQSYALQVSLYARLQLNAHAGSSPRRMQQLRVCPPSQPSRPAAQPTLLL
jgi:hypothetical protein